jgi:hypothetical protein
MRKTKSVLVKVTEKEFTAWKLKAHDRGITVSEFVRQQCRSAGRPSGKARRPPIEYCVHGTDLEEQCVVCDAERERELAEQAAAVKRRTEEAAKLIAEQERRDEARRLAHAAGGAAKWYAGMTGAEQAKWADLKDELLAAEKRRLKDIEFAKEREKPLTLDGLAAMMGTPKPEVDVRPHPFPVLTGILEIDAPILEAQYRTLGMTTKERITARYEPGERPPAVPDKDGLL